MMIAVRIRGQVNVSGEISSTLNSLRLMKKYSCVVIKETPEILGMIKKVRQFIMYGNVNDDVLKLLIEKRARKPGNKPILKTEVEKVEKEIKSSEIKTIKPFFALHPPIGGFKKSTKKMFPKGILGENKNINELIRRML